MALARYEVADLQRLISDETGDGDFVADYLKGIAEALNQNPEQYRGFGPYWWPLKALLIEMGYTAFGTEIEDDDARQQLTYPSAALTVAAAYTFSEHAFSRGMQAAPAHTVQGDDGEVVTYHAGDEEVEQLIVARAYLQARRGGSDGQA